MPQLIGSLSSVVAVAAASLTPTGGAAADAGTQASGVRFSLIQSRGEGVRQSRAYRVTIGSRDVGTLRVRCDGAQLVGASFAPRGGSDDGTRVAAAADHRLCR